MLCVSGGDCFRSPGITRCLSDIADLPVSGLKYPSGHPKQRTHAIPIVGFGGKGVVVRLVQVKMEHKK